MDTAITPLQQAYEFATRSGLALSSSPARGVIVVEPHEDALDLASPEALASGIRSAQPDRTGMHACGTARMGAADDPSAVVDERCGGMASTACSWLTPRCSRVFRAHRPT